MKLQHRRFRMTAGRGDILAAARSTSKEIAMASTGSALRSSVIPAMRYRDAPAAIEWLCKVIGFEKHLVVPGPEGTVAHAQLSLEAAAW